MLRAATRPGRVMMCAALLVFGGVQPARAQEAASKPGVVASVNGRELTEADFHRRCERFVGGGGDSAVGYLALREWIQEVIVEEEARKKNVLPSAPDIERRVKALRKQLEFRGQNFDLWLTTHGRTLDSLRDEVRRQLTVENVLTEGVTVSDAEAALFYSSNKEALGLPEQFRFSRISVEDQDTARKVDAALKKGTPFEELARKHSFDMYKVTGGRVPDPVNADPKTDALEREVMERALKLEIGKASGPIKTDDYWVFVRVDEKIAPRAPELADVQDLLLAELRVRKGGAAKIKAAEERMQQLRRESKVQIFRPEYQHIVKLLQEKPKG